jgi:hypothetical protein
MAFLFALMATVSRGFLEFLLSKNFGYAVQLSVVLAFIVALLIFGQPRARPGTKWLVGAAYVFLVTALISTWISAMVEGISYAGTYVLVTFFFAATLVLFSCVRFQAAKRINFGATLSTVGLLLFVVASAQQFAGFALLPGSDRGTFGSLTRPASLTGSYLHYPLAEALIGIVLLGIAAQRSQIRFTLAGLVMLGGVAMSLSRSGIVIVFVAIAAGVLLSKTLAARLRNTLVVGILALAALVLLPSDLFVARILSIFDDEGAGNEIRLSIWGRVLSLWGDSPLIFGSHTGQFTNVTANIATTASATFIGVAESGVLQMLISFGLLGLISYYALMIGTVQAAPTSPPWFRAAAIGAIAQSAVYQSIEVFPFMVIFAMIPLIADGQVAGDPEESLVATRRRPKGRRTVTRLPRQARI